MTGMEESAADSKNQERHVLDWVAVGVAGVLVAVTLMWLWVGAWRRPLVLAGVVLNAVFAALSVYLYNDEEPTLSPHKS